MRTTQCLRIMKIDTARDILYVKGHVPGNRGCFVRVKDAVRRCEFPQPPPFPTFVPQEGAEYPLELVADVGETDPMSGQYYCVNRYHLFKLLQLCCVVTVVAAEDLYSCNLAERSSVLSCC
jgi:hypothetical protein